LLETPGNSFEIVTAAAKPPRFFAAAINAEANNTEG